MLNAIVRSVENRSVYLVAIVASVLLSLLAVYADPLINRGGLAQLMAAEAFVAEGIDGAMYFVSWPFYSVMIAMVHLLCGVPMLVAARLLSGVFFAVLVVAFIALVRHCDGSRRLPFWAALVVLTAPAINEYRHYIISDFGLWACFLLAVLCLYKYAVTEKLRYALYCSVSLLLGVLCRPEAIFLLFTFPLVALFLPTERHRLFNVFSLLLPPVLLFLVIGLIATAVQFPLLDKVLESFDYFYVQQITPGMQEFEELTQRYSRAVLGKYSSEYAGVSLFAALLALIMATTVDMLGPVFLVLAVYGLLKGIRLKLESPMKITLIYSFCLSICMLLLFILAKQALSGRYVVLPLFVMMIYAVFILDGLSEEAAQQGKAKRLNRLAFVLSCLLILDSFVSPGAAKGYIIDSADWIRANTPESASVFTNDNFVGYYSGRRFWYQSREQSNAWIRDRRVPVEAEYWVVHIKRGEEALTGAVGRYGPLLERQHEFINRKGHRIMIFRVVPEDDSVDGVNAI